MEDRLSTKSRHLTSTDDSSSVLSLNDDSDFDTLPMKLEIKMETEDSPIVNVIRYLDLQVSEKSMNLIEQHIHDIFE